MIPNCDAKVKHWCEKLSWTRFDETNHRPMLDVNSWWCHKRTHKYAISFEALERICRFCRYLLFFFSNIHYVWTKRKCHFSQTNRERYTNRATVRRKWGPEHKFTRFVLLCLNTFNGFPAMFAVLISSFFVLSLNRNVNENARWKKRSVAEIARE